MPDRRRFWRMRQIFWGMRPTTDYRSQYWHKACCGGRAQLS
ncbi:MAG: hypothetical protein ACYCUJ_06160 [Acidithiobacillus sp.]